MKKPSIPVGPFLQLKKSLIRLKEGSTLARSISRGVSTSCQGKKGDETSLSLVRPSVASNGSACLWHCLVVRTPCRVLWNRSSLAWVGRQPSLVRWWHHLLFYSGRTYPETKRSTWKVSLSKPEIKCDKVWIFPNSRPLSRSYHQQQWPRGGPRQHCCR